MKRLRTLGLGPFPLVAALSLIVVFPSMFVIGAVGAITGPGMAVAVISVGTLGVYALSSVTAWAAAFAAERVLLTLGALSAPPASA